MTGFVLVSIYTLLISLLVCFQGYRKLNYKQIKKMFVSFIKRKILLQHYFINNLYILLLVLENMFLFQFKLTEKINAIQKHLHLIVMSKKNIFLFVYFPRAQPGVGVNQCKRSPSFGFEILLLCPFSQELNLM